MPFNGLGVFLEAVNFSLKILGLSVGIFGIIFPSPGSCLTNHFGPGMDVFRFVVCLALGLFFFKLSWTETQIANGMCVLG